MVGDNDAMVGIVDVDPNIDDEKEDEVEWWGIYVDDRGEREGRWGIFIQ